MSYATPDRQTATQLAEQLRPNVWVDLYDIDAGAMFLADIADAIERSTDFVLLWSQHSERSSWVRFEVHMAFIRWIEDKAITLRIVPLDDTPLPLYLRPFQQARPEADPAEIAASLLGPAPDRPRPRSFFDRNPEVDVIENALYSNTMMVWLWGMPGIGKRTLAHAAARRFRTRLRQVLRVEIRPGTREVELDLQLAAALKTEPLEAPEPGTRWWEVGAHFERADKDAKALLDDFARAGGLWIFEETQHWLDDDARPTAQLLSVFDALAHANCGTPDRLAIFTSTRKPALAATWSTKTEIVRLEGLPMNFAEALLFAKGAPKDAYGPVADFARKLGGHPLAIELAAPRIADGDLDFDEFRVQVAADLIGGAPISESTRQVLQVLAAVDGPFPAFDIAVHLGLDSDAFQKAVSEASSYALVHQDDDGYSRLHPLVRDYFLRDLIAEPDSLQQFTDLAARSEQFFRSLPPASSAHINSLMSTFRLYSFALDLQSAWSLRSDLTGLLFDCGLSLYQSRQYSDALAYFEEVCIQDPRDDRAQLFRARCLGRLDRMGEARELVDDILAQRPNDHAALRVRGRLEYVAENFHGAVAFYEKAARLRPDYAPSLRDLAQARMRVDDWRGALSALDEALSKGDATAIDLSVYAEILEQQGDRVRARELLDRALRQQPKDEKVLRQLWALDRFNLFGFDATETAVIIVPSLQLNGAVNHRSSLTTSDSIAAEDVFAAQAIERALVSAHWPSSRLEKVQIADRVVIPNPRNLVSICSPKRNRVTGALVSERDVIAATGFWFENYDSPRPGEDPRWRLVLNGERIESPSYDEQYWSVAQGASDAGRGVLRDHAVIMRTPNPWNSRSKVLIVAGLRAFGTQGAAEFILTDGHKLAASTRGRDFVAVVDVELSAHRLRTSLSNHLKLL